MCKEERHRRPPPTCCQLNYQQGGLGGSSDQRSQQICVRKEYEFARECPVSVELTSEKMLLPPGPLAIYLLVYMLLSPFIPLAPSSPPLLSISLFSMSASALLLCEQIRQYHPSRFHIYVLKYDIVFLFLTYFTL